MVLVAVTIGLLGACGGGGSDSADLSGLPTSPSFSVVATEMQFAPSQIAVAAGGVSVELRNDGTVLHDLHIEAQPFILEAGPGQTDSGSIALEPGTYAFFCALPGHRAAGMEGVLEVR